MYRERRLPAGRPLAAIIGLWRNGEQGVWYDTSDLSTMFQDASGTTPVYAPGQGQVDPPVGRILDKSGRGNHAYQNTTTSRPTLSARYNLLTGTESLSTQSVTVAATTYTLTTAGPGSVTLSGAASGTYTAGSRMVTCTAGALTLTVLGSVTQADLRPANDGVGLPPYQRVDDANTYDTVFFPPYLASDGVDDWMMTSSIDFSGASRAIVVAAARKLNDNLANTLLELGPTVNSNPGSFALFGPISAASPGWALRYAGATPSQTINVLSAGPVSALLSARIALDGAGASLSANGITGSNASVSGGGNLGNYALYLFRRAGSTLPFKGRFYGLTIRGGVTSDSQLAAIGKLLNQKAKVF